jgi:uncharacterized Fe-S center protein
MGLAQPCIVPEIGVLGSRDIVAVETATLDKISQAGLIEKSIPPYFKHLDLDLSKDLHPFARIWGPFKNPYLVTEFGERQGLGTRTYKLVELLSPKETEKAKPPRQAYERQPSFY